MRSSLKVACLLFALAPGLARAADVAAELGLTEAPVALRDMKGWTKPKKIVVSADSPARLAWYKEVVTGVEVVGPANPKEALEKGKDADAFVGFCSAQLAEVAPKVRWMQSIQANVDPPCTTVPGIVNGNIILTTMRVVNGPNVAEHTLALMLMLGRQLNTYYDYQRDEKWQGRSQTSITDLYGKNLLVVGLGAIGTDVAKRADAFGMKVTATRNSSHEGPPFVSYVGLPDELPKLIAEADFVVNVLPLTPETKNLFDAAMFARMKPTAYFINVGRGGSVVTDDLVAALKAKKIAGAALDVVDPDPLTPGHPLWHIPNVVITPHVASFSEAKGDRAQAMMRENARRFVAGDKMLSVLDLKKGY